MAFHFAVAWSDKEPDNYRVRAFFRQNDIDVGGFEYLPGTPEAEWFGEKLKGEIRSQRIQPPHVAVLDGGGKVVTAYASPIDKQLGRMLRLVWASG